MSYTPTETFASTFGGTTDAPVMGDEAGTPSAKLSGINSALSELILQVKLTNQLLFQLLDIENRKPG